MLGILRDRKKRALLDQALFLAVVVGLLVFLGRNLAENLDQLGISTGFGFLGEKAGYRIGGALIEYSDQDTYFRAHIVGMLNTILATTMIIATATVLGFIIGVLRLSSNPLPRNVTRYGIEVVRNVPSLVHIVIWFAVALQLPQVRQAWSLFGGAFISNRGIFLPRPEFEGAFVWVLITFLAGVIVAIWRTRRAHRTHMRTGKRISTFWGNLGLITIPALLVYFATDTPMSWETPKFKGFSYSGGLVIVPELFAIWIALSIYFSSHVADLVRGGLQSIGRGQFEAAAALGLRPSISLRLVIIPQAMRVILPPLTTVYQNILKTTSLGVAIGYTEMTATTGGTTLNLTGQAIECVLLLMVSYGVLSLAISAIMSLVERAFALVER